MMLLGLKLKQCTVTSATSPTWTTPNARQCWLPRPATSYGQLLTASGRTSSCKAKNLVVFAQAAGTGGGLGGQVTGGRGGGGGNDDSGNDFDGTRPNLLISLTCVFALLVAAGGLAGYQRKGSLASVVTAGVASVCLLFGALLLGGLKYRAWGLMWGIGSCAGLTTVMGKRYLAAAPPRKFMPAGAVATASLLLGLYHATVLMG